METTETTQIGQITGQLTTLAEIFSTVALYACTDPNRPYNLKLAKITGNTIEATDAYAAIRYETTPDTYTTTPEPFTLPAAEIAQALKLACKQNNKVAHATISATKETWTITTPAGTTTGPNPQHETPNSAPIWATAQQTNTNPFTPLALAAWQIERLAKTTKTGPTKRDTAATLTTNNGPLKPMIYTITTRHGEIELLLMPTKPRNN